MDKIAAGRRLVTTRKNQYTSTFRRNSPDNMGVLEDLANFCHFTVQPPPTTPEAALIAQARREVFERIIAHLELSPTQLFAIATGQPVRAQTRAERKVLEEISNANDVESDRMGAP